MSLRFMRLEDRIVLDGAAAVIIAQAAASGSPTSSSSPSSGAGKDGSGQNPSGASKGDPGQNAASASKGDSGQNSSPAKSDSGQSFSAAKGDPGQNASTQAGSSTGAYGATKPADFGSGPAKPADSSQTSATSTAGTSHGDSHGGNLDGKSHDSSSGSDSGASAPETAAGKSGEAAASFKTRSDTGHEPQGPSASTADTGGKAQASAQASSGPDASSAGTAATDGGRNADSATARAAHWGSRGDSGKNADTASQTQSPFLSPDKSAPSARTANDPAAAAARSASADSATADRAPDAKAAPGATGHADNAASRPAFGQGFDRSDALSLVFNSDMPGAAHGAAFAPDYARNLVDAALGSHKPQSTAVAGGQGDAHPPRDAGINPDFQPGTFRGAAGGRGLGDAGAAPGYFAAGRLAGSSDLMESASPRGHGQGNAASSSQPVRVIAISSEVQGARQLASDVAPGVIAIVYNEGETPAQLLAQITQALHGQQAQSIAIASHENSTGSFDLTDGIAVSAGTVLANAQMNGFWAGVGALLTPTGTIDILACDQAGTVQGEMTIAAIAQVSGHAVDASTNLTGNAKSGGDWVLEQGGVNVATTYFVAGKLGNFQGTLADPGVSNPSANGGLAATGAQITSMAVDANLNSQYYGDIVVAGYAFNSTTGQDDFVVERFNPHGTLDTSFGTSAVDSASQTTIGDVTYMVTNIGLGGMVLTDISGLSCSTVTHMNAEAKAVAIDASDNIVVGGELYNGTNYDFALARYTSTGSLDTGNFGAATGSTTPATGVTVTNLGGMVITDFSGHDAQINALAIDANNNIVAGGYVDSGFATGTSGHNDPAVARYTSTGALDTTFGNTSNNSGAIANVWSTNLSNTQVNSFDSSTISYYNGVVITDFGANSQINAITIDGAQIVATGAIYDSNVSVSHNDFLVARFNNDGSLDSNFGANCNGVVITDLGANAVAKAVTIDGSGQIVIAGVAAVGAGGTSEFALIRYNDGVNGQTDGSLDTSFGPNCNGAVFAAVGASDSGANAVVVDAKGQIVAAGYAGDGANSDFAMAVYDNSGTFVSSAVQDFCGGADSVQAAALNARTGDIILAGYADNGAGPEFALAALTTSSGMLTGNLDTSFGGANFGASGLVSSNVSALADATGAPVYLLAISSDIPGSRNLAADTQAGVIGFVYDESISGAQLLTEMQLALGGVKADSLGVACLGDGQGGFTLTDSTYVTFSTVGASGESAVNAFWSGVGGLVKPSGHIDVVVSGLAGNQLESLPVGQITLEAIALESGKSVYGSSIAIGNTPVLANWTLDWSCDAGGPLTLSGLDLTQIYLGSTLLNANYGNGMLAASSEFTPVDSQIGDEFGFSTAISGNYAVVGAPYHVVDGNQYQGAAYIFERETGGWIEMAELTASDGMANDNFGFSVAISGDWVVVGAPYHSDLYQYQGEAYVYVRNGIHWIQQGEPLQASDATGPNYFGQSVAISGNTVLVGAPHGGTKYYGEPQSGYPGEAYIFSLSYSQQTGYSWNTQSLLAPDQSAFDCFGQSVAIAGNVAVVGTPYALSGDGAAYIYVYDGTQWGISGGHPTQTLACSDTPTGGDMFGSSVATTGAGDHIVVGAPGHGTAGAAYVFDTGDLWTSYAATVLTPSDGGPGDSFGSSVGISDAGDTVIAGAPGHAVGGVSQGAAYVFSRSGGTWTQQNELTAADGASGDGFGAAVAIAGDTLFVGASSHPYNAFAEQSGPGAAYVYVSTGSTWAQLSEVNNGGNLGYSLAISGDTAVVGAPFYDMYNTNYNGGNNEYNDAQGEVFVFTRSGNAWTLQQAISSTDGLLYYGNSGPTDGAAGDEFGFSVAISGDTIIVGAPFHQTGNGQGEAYFYARSGGVWSFENGVTASDGGQGDEFGYSVGISGNLAVVGAPGHNSSQGAAYIVVNNGANWGYFNGSGYNENLELTALDGAHGDGFGQAVAISGNAILVGAPGHAVDQGDPGQGAAYFFTIPGGAGSVIQAASSEDMTFQAAINATQQEVIDPDQGHAFADQFGFAVAISGDRAVIGAPGDGQGAAYFYRNSGESGVWSLQTSAYDPGMTAGDMFGASAGISGNRAVVGAPGTNGAQGAAYVYGQSGGNWSMQKTLTASDGAADDGFGTAVAISNDTVLAGAPYHASQIAVDYSGVPGDPGGFYTYALKPASYETGLSGSTGISGDAFGTSVAINGDYAIVGAPGYNYDQGIAYIFYHGTSGWTLEAQLADPGGPQGFGADEFGYSVGISGSYAIVGAPDTVGQSYDSNEGVAYIFIRSGTTWTEQGTYLENPEHDAGGYFGSSVAISGTNAIVGAPYGGGGSQGAAFIFNRSGSTWSNTATLLDPLDQSGDQFGSAVAIAGNTAVVGAPWSVQGQGAAYIYVYANAQWGGAGNTPTQSISDPGATMGDTFGTSVATAGAGDHVIVGAPGSGVIDSPMQGAAYVFDNTGSNWSAYTSTELAAATGGQAYDQFGYSVAISSDGNLAAVGASQPGYSDAQIPAGKGEAYVFVRAGGSWTQQALLTASDGTTGDGFGSAVAISGTNVLVGAPQPSYDDNLAGPGKAYIYNLSRPASIGGAGDVLQSVTDSPTVSPFANVTVASAYAGDYEQMTVTLTLDPSKGTLAEGTQYDPNCNFTDHGNGTYTFTDTASGITTELDGLVFTPTPNVAALDQLTHYAEDSDITVAVATAHGGTTTADVHVSSSVPQITATYVQPDGNILVAGQIYDANTGHYDMYVNRYTAGGGQDQNFTGGKAALASGGPEIVDFQKFSADYTDAKVLALAVVNPDGSGNAQDIAVAGYVTSSVKGYTDLAVVWLNIGDGSPDTSYGGKGAAVHDFGSASEALAVTGLSASDVNYTVAGGYMTTNPNLGITDMALVQYGGEGILQNAVHFNPGYGSAQINALTQYGQNILAGGYAVDANGCPDFALASVPLDGNGVITITNPDILPSGYLSVLTPFGYASSISALAVDNSSGIVAGGLAYNSRSYTDFALARYLPAVNDSGTIVSLCLDTNFGNGGTATVDFGGSASVSALAIDASTNDIVAAGDRSSPGSTTVPLNVAWFSANGILQGTYATDSGNYSAFTLATQCDGSIRAIAWDNVALAPAPDLVDFSNGNITTAGVPVLNASSVVQSVMDTGTTTPFADFSITDTSSGATETVTIMLIDPTTGLLTTANGSFTTLNGFTSNADGTYTFTGTIAAANAAIEGLVFTPTAEPFGTPGATAATTLFAVKVDDHNSTTTDCRTTVETTVADKLALSGGQSNQPVNSNATTFTPFLNINTGANFIISDTSSSSGTVTIMLSGEAQGTLTPGSGFVYNGEGSYINQASGDTFTSFSGSGGSYTLTYHTVASANQEIQGLIFTPTANTSGTTTFNVSVSDHHASKSDGTTSVTVTAVSAAPAPIIICDSSHLITGPTLDANSGSTVSGLLASVISQSSGNYSLGGIAVSGNAADPSTQGVWEYYSNDLNAWVDINSAGAPSPGNAVMLSASTQIRFAPVSGFSGTAPQLTIEVVDGTYGGSYSDAVVTVNPASPHYQYAGSFSSTAYTLSVGVTGSQNPTPPPPAPPEPPAPPAPPEQQVTPPTTTPTTPPTTPVTTNTNTVSPAVNNSSTTSNTFGPTPTDTSLPSSLSTYGFSPSTIAGLGDTGLTGGSTTALISSLNTALSQPVTITVTTTLTQTGDVAKTVDIANQITTALDKAITTKDITDTAKVLSGGNQVQETKIADAMATVTKDVDKAVQQKGDPTVAKASIEASVAKAAAANGITNPAVVKGMQTAAVTMFNQERAANSKALLQVLIPRKN